MTRQQFIEYAIDTSLKFAQERARNFKISETQIELWSHFFRGSYETTLSK